ncbi:MAG: nucleotide exchange factor GrpE [Alphaproteobacteria bacterium]|nr:nucleotide exchange factor GrpE [Alphaproteobacteria bacterium]
MSKNKKNNNEEDIIDEMMEKQDNAEDLEQDAANIDEAFRLEELEAENRRLKEDYLRAFADAENVKKRCQQEIDKNNKYAIASFAKSLLSVADNLQRAVDAASKEENNEACANLLKGVELTQNELTRVFEKFNIQKMNIMGTVFDPNFHQVIQEVVDVSKPVGTVVTEIQTGYMINDRILREAMVVVTKH